MKNNKKQWSQGDSGHLCAKCDQVIRILGLCMDPTASGLKLDALAYAICRFYGAVPMRYRYRCRWDTRGRAIPIPMIPMPVRCRDADSDVIPTPMRCLYRYRRDTDEIPMRYRYRFRYRRDHDSIIVKRAIGVPPFALRGLQSKGSETRCSCVRHL